MRIKCNSNKGFVAAEAILGVGIFLLLSTLIVSLVLTTYNVQSSTHRVAMATNYVVEILEAAKALDYNDSLLDEGVYEAGVAFLGVKISENYDITLTITDYNKMSGNEGKEDYFKILDVNVQYKDGNLTKDFKMSTLKYNNNIKRDVVFEGELSENI